MMPSQTLHTSRTTIPTMTRIAPMPTSFSSLEIAPEGLFPFDCLEQCLEIAFSKPP